MYIILLLVCSLLIACTQAKLTLLAGKDVPPIGSVPTQDFFQVRSPYFVRTGPAVFVQARIPKGAKAQAKNATGTVKPICKASKLKPNPARVQSREILNQFSDTILVAEWSALRKCGLTTLTQVTKLASAYGSQLPAAGFPPARTLVLLLNNAYKGTGGNPIFEPYMARGSGIPDGTPPSGLNVIIVPNTDRKTVYAMRKAALAKGQKVKAFTVEQEPGPWNTVFISIPYLLTVYGIFTINLAVILFSLYSVVRVIRSGEFVMGLRNYIFITGIIGISVYSSSLLMRNFAFPTKVIEAVGSFLISVAFHMLLYLWSVFLMQIRHNKSVYYFRGLVLFGLLVVCCAFISSIVLLSTAPNNQTRLLAKIIGYLLPITQIVIAVAFLGYAVKFLRRRETVKISQQTYQALTRLGQVAVVAFLAYFAVAATNMDFVSSSLVTPGALCAAVILRMVSASVRGLALLTVLGVRTPKKATSIGSSNMFSSTQSSISTTSTLTGKGSGGVGKRVSTSTFRSSMHE